MQFYRFRKFRFASIVESDAISFWPGQQNKKGKTRKQLIGLFDPKQKTNRNEKKTQKKKHFGYEVDKKKVDMNSID